MAGYQRPPNTDMPLLAPLIYANRPKTDRMGSAFFFGENIKRNTRILRSATRLCILVCFFEYRCEVAQGHFLWPKETGYRYGVLLVIHMNEYELRKFRVRHLPHLRPRNRDVGATSDTKKYFANRDHQKLSWA